MNLRKTLDRFYYSTALCDLQLMNKCVIDDKITHNSLLYIELIYSMDGTCTASQLAEMLNISKPAVTAKINELIRQGLVTKEPDPNDRRRAYLRIDEEKIPQYKLYKWQDSEAVKRITAHYSDEDINKFCEMLNLISDINFENINGGSK